MGRFRYPRRPDLVPNAAFFIVNGCWKTKSGLPGATPWPRNIQGDPRWSVGGVGSCWGCGEGRMWCVAGPKYSILLANGCQMGAGGPNWVYDECAGGPLAPW